MATDEQRLSRYVDVWEKAVDHVVALLRDLDQEEWSTQTDLPGWNVRAVAAHLAHLESELCGDAQERVEIPELEHLTAPSAAYTEGGVLAREAASNEEIVDELEQCVGKRLEQLRADPPEDGSAKPPITPGGMPWDWETMLRNRPLDVWMHEQDIRRATGRPGGLNSEAAGHTATVFTMGFPYSVGKKVAPPAGTTVVLDVSGVSPVHLAVEMNDSGRCVPLAADPDAPTVSLRMDLETFIVLCGGRRDPEQVDVAVTGDTALGGRILQAMGVTP